MECKLELSVFRFDAKTDFLPYYKKHFLKIDKAKTLNDLFVLIQGEDLSFDYPKDEYAAIKLNGKALFTNVLIEEVIANFGKSLVLEPLSPKRVVKDMIINDDDFYASFDLIDAFVEARDRATFKSYILFHYASSVLEFMPQFQGDALFAFAYDMAIKYPQRKKEILNIVANEYTGIFYHVRLCNKVYPCGAQVEQKIVSLKNDIMAMRPFANALVEKLSHRTESL